jgi:hypothetical protein
MRTLAYRCPAACANGRVPLQFIAQKAELDHELAIRAHEELHKVSKVTNCYLQHLAEGDGEEQTVEEREQILSQRCYVRELCHFVSPSAIRNRPLLMSVTEAAQQMSRVKTAVSRKKHKWSGWSHCAEYASLRREHGIGGRRGLY